ncbi:MAG: hypothetical protein ACRD1V_02385 [Vicinamibacterales bacterium]
MSTPPLTHIPVAAGPAYREAIRRLPSTFTATISAEPGNRFNLTAVAVHAGGEKIGYLPPDLSNQYFAALRDRTPVECPGRHASPAAHEDTGVDLLLDLTRVPCVS